MSTDTSTFAGFDPAAIARLDELPTWDAARYATEKAALLAGLVRPAQAFIAELAERLDAPLTVTARGSVSPLHTDLRFAAADAPRYKDHLLMTMWQGEDKREAPILWVRVDAHRVGLASGIGLAPPHRDRWRAAVAGDDGAELATELARLVAARGAEIAGDSLKNVPAPYPADHPRADLLRLGGFQVRYIESLPAEVTTAAFVDWVATRLADLLPVHRWLVTRVAPGTA